MNKFIINGIIMYQLLNCCFLGWVMLYFFLLYIYENNFDKKYFRNILVNIFENLYLN